MHAEIVVEGNVNFDLGKAGALTEDVAETGPCFSVMFLVYVLSAFAAFIFLRLALCVPWKGSKWRM